MSWNKSTRNDIRDMFDELAEYERDWYDNALLFVRGEKRRKGVERMQDYRARKRLAMTPEAREEARLKNQRQKYEAAAASAAVRGAKKYSPEERKARQREAERRYKEKVHASPELLRKRRAAQRQCNRKAAQARRALCG